MTFSSGVFSINGWKSDAALARRFARSFLLRFSLLALACCISFLSSSSSRLLREHGPKESWLSRARCNRHSPSIWRKTNYSAWRSFTVLLWELPRGKFLRCLSHIIFGGTKAIQTWWGSWGRSFWNTWFILQAWRIYIFFFFFLLIHSHSPMTYHMVQQVGDVLPVRHSIAQRLHSVWFNKWSTIHMPVCNMEL